MFHLQVVKQKQQGFLDYKLLSPGAEKKNTNFRISEHSHVQCLPQIKTMWVLLLQTQVKM